MTDRTPQRQDKTCLCHLFDMRTARLRGAPTTDKKATPSTSITDSRDAILIIVYANAQRDILLVVGQTGDALLYILTTLKAILLDTQKHLNCFCRRR